MRLLRIHCQLSPEPTAIPTQATLQVHRTASKSLTPINNSSNRANLQSALCACEFQVCVCAGGGGTQYKWDSNYIAAHTHIAAAACFLCFVLPYLKKHWVSFVLFYLREEALCSLLQDLTMKFILKCPSRPTLKCNKLSQCILANLHAGSEMLSALSVRKPRNGMSYHRQFKKWTGSHKILGGAVNWASETQNFLISRVPFEVRSRLEGNATVICHDQCDTVVIKRRGDLTSSLSFMLLHKTTPA